jgi:5-methylcytosine-specific restriction protein A
MRSEFPRVVMRLAFEQAAGLCANCHGHLYAGKFQYDHRIPDSIGGKPTLENCQVLCNACHGLKTALVDTPRAAKTKRQGDKHIGAMPKRRSALSHPTLRKKMNGEVVSRPASQERG